MNTLDVSVYFLVYFLPGLAYVWMAVIVWLVVTIIWYKLQRKAEQRDADVNEGVTMIETCIYGGDAGEPGGEVQSQAAAPLPSADTWAIKIDSPTYFRVQLERHARKNRVRFTEIERLCLYSTAIEAQFEMADLRLLAARLAQPTEPLPTVQP